MIRSKNSCKFRRNSTSQAAMEFLMTYGWAVLVVLVAIGALAYFGVLSPDMFLQNRCQLPPGITCLDFSIEPSKIDFALQNNIGETITIDEVRVTNKDDESCASTGSISLRNGEKAIITILDCDNVYSGNKFSGELAVTYTKLNLLSHVTKGTVSTRTAIGGGGGGDGNGGPVYPDCSTNANCNEGEFCELPAGQCNVPDIIGTCTLIPQSCPGFYEPVCGCDDVTYSNECTRRIAQVQLDYDGECGGRGGGDGRI